MVLEIIAFAAISYIAVQAYRSKQKSEISIKESMDLSNLPVLTFYEGDIKLNFLLDSGSTESHICGSSAKDLLGTPITIEGYNYLTSTGSDNISKKIDSVLRYKESEFKVSLMVNESLDQAFADVKSNCGVQLHGILGSDFLREHKYVLDFEKLIVYPNK